MSIVLRDISDGVTNAVSDEIRRASARFSNFEMGHPGPGDETSTAHYERIIAQLEVESIRVHTAMNEDVEAVRLGRLRAEWGLGREGDSALRNL